MNAVAMLRAPHSLRAILALDAAASGATGLLLIAGAGLLEGWLNVPAVLMREAGIILIPYVALVAIVATRRTVSRRAVNAIVICNAAWTIASFALLFSGWIAPNWLGQAFIAGQAVVVAGLGYLQYAALRPSHA